MQNHPSTALDKRSAILLAGAVLLGLAYFIALPFKDIVPLQWLLKGSGIILLAVIAWMVQRPRHKGLVLGLALGAGGDILLEVSTFVAGLGSFLISHLVYTCLFLIIIRQEGMKTGIYRQTAGLVAIAAVAMGWWLLPDLGEFAIPVLIYIAVIAAMTMAAILTPFQSKRVLAGAVIFMISDSLIAIGKFKSGFPGIDQAIWATYFTAQYCIATGFLMGWERKDS